MLYQATHRRNGDVGHDPETGVLTPWVLPRFPGAGFPGNAKVQAAWTTDLRRPDGLANVMAFSDPLGLADVRS